MNQVGIATTEVAYLADALMALEILERTAAAVLDALRPAATTEEVVRSAAETLGVPEQLVIGHLLRVSCAR
jgi:hypothetical protein